MLTLLDGDKNVSSLKHKPVLKGLSLSGRHFSRELISEQIQYLVLKYIETEKSELETED